MQIRSRFTGPAANIRFALTLGLISLYFALSTIPTISRSTVSLTLAMAGVILALRTRIAQKSEPIKVRTASALVVGFAAAIVGVLSLSAAVLLNTEISRYEECAAGAITHASAQACQTQLRDDLNARITHLRSSTQQG
ncbi:hypothetical protein GALL_435690 [mine drainage metagenome]|uniref:DUF4190 domain-containing protein n=1 Tax=mine drainage metagenome TaxID=410659 RepID=A0A1J5Q4C9_9ZZZZ